MRLRFRAKLMAIVGTAAVAFLVLIGASLLLEREAARQTSDIRERYLPRLELGPELESQFERLRRALQDAVAADDAEALAATRVLLDELLASLERARDLLVAEQVDALRAAVLAYYETASDVSRRIIAGETGEDVVGAMGTMQARHARSEELLLAATSFDRAALSEAFVTAASVQATAARLRIIISVVCLVAVVLLSLWVSSGLLRGFAELTAGLQRFGKGDFSKPVSVTSGDELGEVAEQANLMAESLTRLNNEREDTAWLTAARAGLGQELAGELEPEQVAERASRFLARLIEAPAAALYVADGEELRLLGHYALSSEGVARTFRRGEGLIGQAARGREVVVVKEPPADYLRVSSGLGEARPRTIALVPMVHGGRITGVLELALFQPWTARHAELAQLTRETVAVAVEVALARRAMRELLDETQRQARQLATQEEELRASNDELHAQQEQLRRTNEALETKASELATVSSYKSQFLANMSHELRTPLNSMLLLSSLLARNEAGNLSAKQVEYAQTIQSAGNDLLALINQVLDLAKVEAGKQTVRLDTVAVAELVQRARGIFEPLARSKGLELVAEIAPGVPATIPTDVKLVNQIVNNLVANAIKFTERGSVTLRFELASAGTRVRRRDLDLSSAVALTVTDTGVGIAPEDLERIFVPFEQVEATPDRRFGGTGLGLTIARELCDLLGGELQVHSEPGVGSTFSCILPLRAGAARTVHRTPSASHPPIPRRGPRELGSYLLVIEDDPVFAGILAEIITSQGLPHRVAHDWVTAQRLVKDRKPNGIILDMKLPDEDGWSVMRALQADPDTADIPVHIVSALDAVGSAEQGLALGAIGYQTKPATHHDLVAVVQSLSKRRTPRACRVLIVEDDVAVGESLVAKLEREELVVRHVQSGRGALAALAGERFDCMIVDLSLPDMDGIALLQAARDRYGDALPSVVVYTARSLSREEASRLEAFTDAVVVKDGPSAERLLDEVRLFVRKLKEHPEGLSASPLADSARMRLDERQILIVDDDMRTVYALSATLRARGAEVLVAEDGKAAIELLGSGRGVDAVLVDIMMPEMDGYETMRRLRKDGRLDKVPIIALTAKAMGSDRERCLEAGATDYLPKPVDADRLVAMLHSHLTMEAHAREQAERAAGR